MTTLRRILTGVSLTIMASGLASANVIGYSTDFPTSGSNPNTDFNYTLTLPKFNTNGGLYNLTGATMFFYVDENVTSITLNNAGTVVQTGFEVSVTSDVVDATNATTSTGHMTNSANSADIYHNETMTLFDNEAAIGIGGTNIPSSGGPISLGPGTGSSSVAACANNSPLSTCSSVLFNLVPSDANITDPVLGLVSSTGVVGVDGAILSITMSDADTNYECPASGCTFTLAGGTFSGVSIFGGGSVGGSVIANGLLQAEIDYSYTVNSGTPEPSTMILLGAGLLGIGFLRKRVKP